MVSIPSKNKEMGQWSSGYDVALTTRRSPVRFRPGPLTSFIDEGIVGFNDTSLRVVFLNFSLSNLDVVVFFHSKV